MFSSVGRASRLHREGQEFESLNIHQNKKPSKGWFFSCLQRNFVLLRQTQHNTYKNPPQGGIFIIYADLIS